MEWIRWANLTANNVITSDILGNVRNLTAVKLEVSIERSIEGNLIVSTQPRLTNEHHKTKGYYWIWRFLIDKSWLRHDSLNKVTVNIVG